MSVSGQHRSFDGHLNEKWPLMGVGWAANRKLRPLLCDVARPLDAAGACAPQRDVVGTAPDLTKVQ
jgi:hypothetical protein